MRRLEQITVEALLGRPVPPGSLPEAEPAELQWEAPGAGPVLQPGSTVKGDVTATADVGGREVVLEHCHLHGRLGTGSWVPAIEV